MSTITLSQEKLQELYDRRQKGESLVDLAEEVGLTELKLRCRLYHAFGHSSVRPKFTGEEKILPPKIFISDKTLEGMANAFICRRNYVA